MLNIYHISSEKKTNFFCLIFVQYSTWNLKFICSSVWLFCADTGYCYETWGDLFCHIMKITANEHSLFNWIFSSYSLTTLWYLTWLCGLIPIRKLASYFPTPGCMIKRPLSTVFWGWLSLVFRCTVLQELWHILGEIFMLGEGGAESCRWMRPLVWSWHRSEWGQIVRGLCKANYLVIIVHCGRFHTADLRSVLKQTAK